MAPILRLSLVASEEELKIGLVGDGRQGAGPLKRERTPAPY